MPDINAPGSRGATLRRFLRVAYSRFLWLIVLVPTLGVSAYSFYWVGTHFGVPPLIAIFISTCFDGSALVAADYSLKYAEKGMSPTKPQAFVRVVALTSAFLQTFHAKLAGEPRGAWVMWAALPVIAVVLYDIHISFERRKALARSGQVYPAPLPKWGLASWSLFFLSTLNALRDVTLARREALKTVALQVASDFRREADRTRNTRERIEPVADVIELEPTADGATVAPEHVMAEHRARHAAGTSRRPHSGSWAQRHSPEREIKDWARTQPAFRDQVGQRGKTPARIKEAFYQAHPDKRPLCLIS